MKIRQLLMHVGLALAATWPTVMDPLTRMVGHPDADVWNHAWGPWWFWETLRQGDLPWRCDWLFAPEGGTLWFIDPLGAIVGALLVPLLGIAGAWNAVVIAGVTATSWAAKLLSTRVTGPGHHTWIASLALVFGPYMIGELHNGISEAMLLAPGLLSLALAHTALTQGGLRSWLQVGGALALTTLGSPYYALAALLAIVTWSIPWLLERPSFSSLGQVAGGTALAGVLVTPLILLIHASLEASDALVHRASPAVAELVLHHNRVDPRTFVAPFGFQSVDYTSMGEAFVHSGYLGWSVLALAVIGWRRTRLTAFAAGGLVSLVFALGPALSWGAEPLTIGGRQLMLPFALLERWVPVQTITHTLRLAVPGLAVTAVLASAAVRDLPRGRLVALVVVPLDMILWGGGAWPLARTPVLDTSAQQALAARSVPTDQSIVLDLPGAVGNTMATSRYLVLQGFHGRRIPYRPDARASSSALLGVPTFQLLALGSEIRPEHRAMLLPAVQDLTTVNRKDLARAGVAEVVVHRDLERGAQRTAETEQLLTALYGAPEVHGQAVIYTVSGTGTVPLDPALLGALIAEP